MTISRKKPSLEELDRAHDQKLHAQRRRSYEYMNHCYTLHGRDLVRALYEKTADWCPYFSEGADGGSCGFSSIARNHPHSNSCGHTATREMLVEGLTRIFDIPYTEDTAHHCSRIIDQMTNDGFLDIKECRKYAGGPLSVVFNTPSSRVTWVFNTDRIAGASFEVVDFVQIAISWNHS